jgi:hypothetical protein
VLFVADLGVTKNGELPQVDRPAWLEYLSQKEAGGRLRIPFWRAQNHLGVDFELGLWMAGDGVSSRYRWVVSTALGYWMINLKTRGIFL